jgi:hypothetical protein
MSSNSGGELFWPVVIIGVVAWMFVHDSDWVIRLYAENHYDLTEDKVGISGNKPHDCEFITAPLGSKHCSYEREYLAEWLTLSGDSPPRPITYGTLQEQPPTRCSADYSDLMHKCYYAELSPNEHATSQWRARRVEIRWKKVEQ